MGFLIQVGRIAAAILVFGIIIMVHELGHFIAAKCMGVKVNEFAIGMGPRLFRFGKKETQYSLRLFPIGGYCAMEGEDSAGGGEVKLPEQSGSPSDGASDCLPGPDPRAFNQKKVWRRMIIILAGPVMNLVLGFVLLIGYYGFCMLPDAEGKVQFSSTTVSVLKEDAPSYQTGLRPGDTILKVDGKTVFTDRDLAMLLQSDEDGVFDMTVRREVDGKAQKVNLEGVTFQIVTQEDGTRLLQYDFYVQGIPRTFGSTIAQSAKMECTVSVMIWRTLGGMLTGQYGLNDLSGPVGTVDAIGDVVVDATQQEHWQIGLGNILMLVVLISVNVGIFNLLPVPALDGGRLLFLLIELLFRKPVPPKYEGMIHAIGLLLLFGLIILVTFSDILKLFH